MVLAYLAGCAEAPKAPLPTESAQPAVATVSVAPPPSSPAVPPVDGAATSVGTAAGSVAPVRVQPTATQIATASAVTPAGTPRYECVRGPAGAETRQIIVFPENSGRVCSRFPAMGPCQYERAACRAKGGRVIRFDGIEITTDVEKEYDKQVQRFRLNAG